MFNKGDLVRVLSRSIESINITNKVTPFITPNTSKRYYSESEGFELSISFNNKTKKDPNGPIGRIEGSIKGGIYMVKLDNQEIMCFPEELELVYLH